MITIRFVRNESWEGACTTLSTLCSTPRFYMRTLLYLRYFRLQLRALFDRTLSFRFVQNRS